MNDLSKSKGAGLLYDLLYDVTYCMMKRQLATMRSGTAARQLHEQNVVYHIFVAPKVMPTFIHVISLFDIKRQRLHYNTICEN